MTDLPSGAATTTSRNGRYRVVARRVAQPPAGISKVQRSRLLLTGGHFVYELHDLRESRLLWSRPKPADEAPPVRLLVEDDGWVIACVHGFAEGLIFLSPDGEATGSLDALQDIIEYPGRTGPPDLEAERALEFSSTTAGVFWTAGVLFTSLRWKGRPYLGLRLRTGRRVLLDLEDGCRSAESAVPAAVLDAAEVAEVRRSLLRGLHEARKDSRRLLGLQQDLSAAASAAGLLGVDGVLPLLAEVARLRGTGRSWTSRALTASGGDEALHARPLTLVAQLASRRLGGATEALAGYQLLRGSPIDPVPVDGVPDRARKVEGIQEGQGARALLEEVGSPDWIDLFAGPREAPIPEAWHYDLVDAELRTVRVSFDPEGRVSRVEEQRPSPARHGGKRENDWFG